MGGNLRNAPSLMKTCYDQLTYGQVDFVPFDEVQDKIYIGKDNKKYEIHSGVAEWQRNLKMQFPQEHDAINKFFELLQGAEEWRNWIVTLKTLPLWLSKFLYKTGIVGRLTGVFGEIYKGASLKQVVENLTKNKDLREVLAFRWNVGGAFPDEMPFLWAATIDIHYTKHKSFWPVGGASEIPFNMIPVIKMPGGEAFVNARIDSILFDGEKAKGVRVIEKGKAYHNIFAPNIVSTIGLIETTLLIPEPIAKGSELSQFAERVNAGIAPFYGLFSLNGTKEELGLTSVASWHFEYRDLGHKAKEWTYGALRQSLSEPLPTLAFSSNSAKDPNWERLISHVGRSTISGMIPVSWEWFKPFLNDTRRTSEDPHTKENSGQEYEAIKEDLGKKIWDKITELHPEFSDRLIFSDFVTPLDHVNYLGKYQGGIYGMKVDLARYDDPIFIASLRPKTDIPGLYMSGQDIFTVGVTSNMMAGVVTAGAILERNTLLDLISLHNNIRLLEKSQKNEL